ncbi:Guanine nucleotide-binding protein subunit gamma 1 [Acorus calamus]|uniref:Guanine nucleotide-binding protein subunit gamma 1 n=1 Tax=Acorus calamus TaxID=4465 RepID=A0AAV9EWF9_ACOCL|nr:Guanine nucleotide-binding protein subunit gamma 1 [Acorus calamus]
MMTTTTAPAGALEEGASSSSSSEPRGSVGKHRLAACVARLTQEIQSLQEELDELESMESSAVACKEVLTIVDNLPDGLLPITKGPENATWDRWFQKLVTTVVFQLQAVVLSSLGRRSKEAMKQIGVSDPLLEMVRGRSECVLPIREEEEDQITDTMLFSKDI